MADNPARPSEPQVQAFMEKMRTYRDTLPEDEQRLLNSMFLAAVGNRADQEGDVHGYWYGLPLHRLVRLAVGLQLQLLLPSLLVVIPTRAGKPRAPGALA